MKDFNGKGIDGKLYEKELEKTNQTEFIIENII